MYDIVLDSTKIGGCLEYETVTGSTESIDRLHLVTDNIDERSHILEAFNDTVLLLIDVLEFIYEEVQIAQLTMLLERPLTETWCFQQFQKYI